MQPVAIAGTPPLPWNMGDSVAMIFQVRFQKDRKTVSYGPRCCKRRKTAMNVVVSAQCLTPSAKTTLFILAVGVGAVPGSVSSSLS